MLRVMFLREVLPQVSIVSCRARSVNEAGQPPNLTDPLPPAEARCTIREELAGHCKIAENACVRMQREVLTTAIMRRV